MISYPQVGLASVYGHPEPDQSFYFRELYKLLSERTPEESISHEEMPSWPQHVEFVKSMPYKEWYLIQNGAFQVVGSIYITRNNEIGVFVFKDFRGHKIASAAIYTILENYPDETFFANINPENQKSIELFSKFGFTYIQNTYKRTPAKLVRLGALVELEHLHTSQDA